MHPIAVLQDALVAVLDADAALATLIGPRGVFDMPPKGRTAPYVVIDRHDMRQTSGDAAPGQEHRVLLQCWSGGPSRKAALAIAERVVVAGIAVAPVGLAVTHAEHVRTETMVDTATGQAKAAVLLRFFSE